ncbi:uncharacterized protein BT62DRAFT_989476 [Guyanagaster necrorhizus]|uniref:Amino acid permease/ SLC12A domain-containing protein n=1 Tax=Guyanagaster necrorhizus TaxID=856835 RepID=A0A9P8AL20_9AGAR|nr:uncharacterized protein BT62DRAFT_989476 [Guyanagaster necrorhizus MCA 3950]KAG7439773.1 hypothetical protein BT62DRAFT_989476 [Guyanagaster necrorhizus MCA 3950]
MSMNSEEPKLPNYGDKDVEVVAYSAPIDDTVDFEEKKELKAGDPCSPLGAIVHHAEYFFDPALSFAQGWNYIYSNCVSRKAEVTASAVLIQFWTTISNGLWITILGVLLIISNLLFVRVYGELEFSFAILKTMLIAGLIVMGLVIDLGNILGGGPHHHRYGFQYWRNPGPFVQYLARLWRVFIFYVLGIFIVGIIVPSNDDNLLGSSGDASQSPFVIAANRAGIKVSAGNLIILNGSRNLYRIAYEGRAPKIFLRVSQFGVPYVAVTFLSVFTALGYMTLQNSASTVFAWFQDLMSAATIVHWIIICMVYLRFYCGMKKQGISRDELPWKSPLQPYTAWLGFISFSIILLTGGHAVFFSSYRSIPLIFVLCFGYKFWMKSKLVPLDEMPIRKYIDVARENPEPPRIPVKGWKRISILWS